MNAVGRINATTFSIDEFTVPTPASGPNAIALGPDGNLWFTESNANQIGRVTATGAFTEFAVPTANASPQSITAGPDGNVWFTEWKGLNVGRISP
jgi:virginiamycin B lyase